MNDVATNRRFAFEAGEIGPLESCERPRLRSDRIMGG